MVWSPLIQNEIIVSVVAAFAVCQCIKLITASAERKKFTPGVIFETGGMPSTHSAFVASLALSVGFVEGFLSSIFLLALGIAMVVIRDAIGVRRTVDDLIHAVNSIIQTKRMRMEHIRVIAGHTPVQVFVGVVLS
ncbi:divergent PAP2 family protein, partial [Candidatus Woesearchaeota archaeon]|nr:divergent PAP2 family protein [Candidatus Woesearchaeota archaeon]